MASCSICNTTNLSEVLELKSYPAYIVPVPQNIASTVQKADLKLFCCDNCGHFQSVNPDKELQRLIYEVYYSYYVVDSSESFSPHYRKPFVDFLQKLKKDGNFENKNNLLEIGCSSGQQVDFFKSIIPNYVGIDPSDKIEKAIETHQNEHFIKGYFPESLPNLNFDVIISQFNLEHILDIQDFLSKIYDALLESGIIIFQVPDIEDFVRNKLPNFMAHEHLQYFTKDSLGKLLNAQGFKVLNWGETGPSLIVAAQKQKNKLKIDFSENLENSLLNKNQIKTLFHQKPEIPASKVAFYGVGPQLYWLLSLESNFNDFVVCDDNPNYENQALPGYGTKILKPSKSIFSEYSLVVLSLNKFYHQVVLEKLKVLNIPLKVCLINQIGVWETIKI